MTAQLIYKEESYKIIGACMKVHAQLGAGFLEKVYQEALSIELNNISIPFEQEVKLELFYNGQKLNKWYKADFICYKQIIIELKAQKFIGEPETKQLLNYLKATNYKLGLLVNFGTPSLTYKRIINL
jgi:GxxExxY protein